MHFSARLALIALLLAANGCRIVQIPSEDGSITSGSTLYDCAAGQECSIDIDSGSVFSDSFTAIPKPGFSFAGWGGNSCKQGENPCNVFLTEEFTALETETTMEPRFIPAQFSKDWLAGKVFYTVYFAGGVLPDGSDTENDVGIVDRLEFSESGVVRVTAVLNDIYDPETIKFEVTGGRLHAAGDDSAYGTSIACLGTGKYLLARYTEEGDSNLERWYYKEKHAVKYANKLVQDIPPEC